MAVKAIQILGGAFPEEFKVQIDGAATMKEILAKMRVTMLKFRAPADVQAAVDQIQKLVAGKQRPEGGEAVPGVAG